MSDFNEQKKKKDTDANNASKTIIHPNCCQG